MTTIAYRDGLIAGDRLGNHWGNRRRCKKIHELDEVVIGAAGNYADCLHFVAWFPHRDERDIKFPMYRGADDAPEVHAIVAWKDSDRVEFWTEHAQPTPILEDFYAVGSGAQAALAAMHMGASAVQAIAIASKIDCGTGDGLESIQVR